MNFSRQTNAATTEGKRYISAYMCVGKGKDACAWGIWDKEESRSSTPYHMLTKAEEALHRPRQRPAVAHQEGTRQKATNHETKHLHYLARAEYVGNARPFIESR